MPRLRPALAATLAVVLAACGVSPTPSPAGPTDTPEPSASVAADSLAVDGIAEVRGATEIRSEPAGGTLGTSEVIGALDAGDRVFVVEGPVALAGRNWFKVKQLATLDGHSEPIGWVDATDEAGEPRLVTAALPCPEQTTVENVLALHDLERIACFGDRSLEISAPGFVCGAGGGPWTWEPPWLGDLSGCALSPDQGGTALPLRTPPGIAGPDPTGDAVVRGHFDDPAARGCRVTSQDPAYPAPSDEEAVLMCRAEFVVED